MGGHWAELKEAIDNIDDRQLARQLGDLYRSDGLNDSQKAAITDYARKSNYHEGVRMAGEKNAAEDLIAPEQQELINAYNDGAAASLRDIATKQVIYGDYMQARGMFGNEQLQELDALSVPEEVYIAEHPEQAGLLTAYFNAKARKDGLIDATRAEVEDRVQRSADAVRAKIHTDGNIYPVVMKEGTSAYIISGDIYLNEDGTIDTKRSTGRVVIWRGDGDSGMTDIRSENGKADMVDVHELGAVHNVSPGAAMEEAVRNTARTEAYEKAAAEIEGRQMELEQGQPAAQVTGSVAANDIAPAGQVAAHVERQGEIPPGEQPTAAAPVYPTDKDDNIDYDAIESPEMLAAALQQEFGTDAQALAIQSMNEARERLAQATANTKGNPMQRLRAVKAAEREVAKFEQVAGSLTPAAGQSVGESSGRENLQEPGRSPIFVNENNSENGQRTEGKSDERGDREDNGQAVASKRPRRGTGVSERLSQGADGGGIETGGRVGQEAPHDRGSESATGYVGQAARRKGSKKEQLKAIEATAKEAGMWIDDPFSLGNYFSEGGENEVYHNPSEEKVYKINNFEYAGDDVSEFFDRIDVHNDLFGNVPYKIIGFSKNSKGEISAVLEQPYVESEREATEDEIAAYMEAHGFEPDGVDVFDNGRYTVFDAVPNNVLMGKDGRLYFIDPQISVNQPEAGSINEVSETGQAHSKTISDGDAYPEQLRLRFRDRNPIFDMDDSEIPVGNRASTLVKLKELFPRSIDKGGVGKLYLQKLRECAEKIFKGEALYNRFSYGEQDGLARGGVFHVEASLILGASAREGETQDEINERQEAEIENYARARGRWIENTFDVFNQKYYEYLGDGAESHVWQDKIGHVIKSTDPYLFRTLQDKLDNITLHNSYFPEVPIEVIGFGKSPEDIFQLILKQPFIVQRPQFNATAAQIAAEVKSRGFDIHEGEELLNNYKNDKTLLRDLHADNVIVTRSGKIMIIDPIMNLNVPSLGYGGTRTLDESVDIAPDGVRFRDNNGKKSKDFENGRRRDAYSVTEADNRTTGLFAETAGKRRMDILRPRSTWNENGKNGEDSENGIPPDRNIQLVPVLSANRKREANRREGRFEETSFIQSTGDASQAYPRRGGGHRKDVGGVAEREGYGILRSPENAVGRYRPPSLDYKTTLSLFEGLQQEYEELLENRENNHDFESDLNRWRDRKVEVVRDYLYSLQEQYGTNDIIIVLNGATDVETKWEVGRIVNPNITEDDLNKIVEQWEAIVGEAVGLKIKGYDVVIFDVMTSDNINRLEDFKKIFIHESTHSIIDHILTNEQLVEVLNEAKDVPDFKKILDHPAYRDQEDYNKGAEIITHSIGDLTFARKNYAFDLYVNGIFTIEETLERINYDIPYTKQRIAEVLEAFKYGREEKTTRAYFGRGTGAEGGVFPEVEEKISRDSIRRGRQYPGVERAGVASGATGTDAETGRGEGTKRQQLNLTIPNLDAEITTAVRQATAHIGVPVRIVEDVEEIVSEDAALQVRQRAARGWYDTATGETVVVVPNHDSAADAVATVLHEAVGHHGMRALYGDAFDSFLEQVYAEVGEDVRRDIFRLSQTLGKDFGNIKLATEEYIASLAEQGIRNPFAGATIVWKKIKDALNALLRRFGIAVSMSENDLRYLLWKSYNRIKAGDGLMDIARKAAADAELSPYRSGRVLRFRENRWPVKRLAVS